MKTTTKMMTASAVVAVGLAGAAASSASAAYSISGGAYTGSGLNAQTFKIGAAGPTVTCTVSSFTGSATGAASTSFLASFTGTGSGGSCNGGALGNVSITVTGNWTLTASTGSGPYGGTVAIPGTSNVVIKPLTVPTCTITISSAGNSALTGASSVAGPPARLYGTVGSVQYTASAGCPGVASGTRADATYSTGGTAASGGVNIPGVTVAGP